ncbi:HU family DNA-binding protein [Epilithonimonas hispanica]|uniref:DNA-binding protein n=1 Tax=Epilithonimonas hispanica TaxID=358687 RepID=A0A3D9D4R0_9FLAO|nr:HU family DNA-binding protein [Epilithonimonas hispanica]REC72992.1 DNA-binding protein [Epilithonimonas hispanica]
MSVKYKVIEKGQPGVAGGGVKKYYATSVFTGEKNLEQLTKSIEKISTVSGADIRAVLYAMVDVITEELSDSQIVRLGELGSLRLNVSSDGKDTSKDVSATAIRSTKLVFTPGKKLKEMQQTLKFEKE